MKHGQAIAWALILGIVLAILLSVKLLQDTAELRFERDVNRMVFNDNLDLLNNLRAQAGTATDSMRKLLEAPAPGVNVPYIVVSIADHRLWYKQGDSVLFTAPVATASGKELVGATSGQHWRFETPRGRLVVQSKDSAPAWVPPDWHYVEQASKRGLGLVHLERGQSYAGYTVQGTDVLEPNGQPAPAPTEGHELVANGNIIVPPFGTTQRRYLGTLGTRRLDLGDGYGIHGTDVPSLIGTSVSHGCVRMLNEDVEKLYPMVPVGTAVYIY
ncbi:MAG: L,D-transpeptidase [Gemmatimonadota bacterium]|nr:L,D-transpeptidase [Gemmatimonadota bacterium]